MSGIDDYVNTYTCGSLLPVIYWELAWNVSRTPYAGHPSGPILRVSSWAPEAERLANVAYTYAVKSTPDTSGITSFFSAVSRRYQQFETEAAIGADGLGRDYYRVLAVMNHHCVGWGNGCDDASFAKLPFSRLPLVWVSPASFAQGDTQELLVAVRMRLGGTPSYAETAAWPYRVVLDTPDDLLSADVSLPTDGVYSVYGAMRSRTGRCGEAVSLQIDDGPAIPWSLSGGACPSTLTWTDAAPPILLPAGKHTIHLRGGREPTEVLALVMERTEVVAGRTPLYRYYNPDRSDSMDAASMAEGAPPWIFQGVTAHLLDHAEPGTTPLYRCFHDGSGTHYDHMTSTSDGCEGSLYRMEGPLGWVYTYQAPGTVPLHRCYDDAHDDHASTISRWCVDAGGVQNYEGVLGYVFPDGCPACGELGLACGSFPNPCDPATPMACGGCREGVCGAIEHNQCCTPRTDCGTECGDIPDGCGGTLSCPTCPEPCRHCTYGCCGTEENGCCRDLCASKDGICQ